MIETTLERIAIALEKLVRLKEATQGKAPLSPEAEAAAETPPTEEKPKKKRGRKPKAEKDEPPKKEEKDDTPKITKDEAKKVLSKLMELQGGSTDDAFEIIQTKGVSKDGGDKPESLGECTEASYGLIVSTAQAKIKQLEKAKKKEDLL